MNDCADKGIFSWLVQKATERLKVGAVLTPSHTHNSQMSATRK